LNEVWTRGRQHVHDQRAHPVRIERFDQGADLARPQGRWRRPVGGIGRHHQHLEFGAQLQRGFYQRIAVHVGHLDVGQQQGCAGIVLDQLQRLHPIGGLADGDALCRQHVGNQAPQLRFIFGENNLAHAVSDFSTFAG